MNFLDFLSDSAGGTWQDTFFFSWQEANWRASAIASVGSTTHTALTVTKAPHYSLPLPENLVAAFDDESKFVVVKHIREFEGQFGEAPSVVSVAEYGKGAAASVGGQSDADDLVLVTNFVPTEWDFGAPCRYLLDSSELYLFRLTITQSRPHSLVSAPGDLGAVPNVSYYWTGRVTSASFNPSLDDAVTQSLFLAVYSVTIGPYPVFPT